MNWLLSLTVFLFQAAAWAGGTVVNGGDVVQCTQTGENELSGLYTLDFLVYRQIQDEPLASVTSFEQSMFRIRKNLALKVPELAPSFDEFTSEILNTDPARKHIWDPVPTQLVEVDDQNLGLTVKIPSNCRINDQIALIQAVIRQPPDFNGSNRIVFKYMPDIFQSLKAKAPLQLSFLLVHEWLWSLSQNAERNRQINWFLHSEPLDRLNRAEVLKVLQSFNFNPLSLPLIVDANGLGHFNNLQLALLNAKAGQTILVREGTYSTAGIRINQPIVIQGDGDRDRIIFRGNPDESALLIQNSQVQIRHVTLLTEESGQDGLRQIAPVLHIDYSSPTIEDCKITSTTSRIFSLVSVTGTSNPKIVRNFLLGGQNIPIKFDELAFGEIRENLISSQTVGVQITKTLHQKITLSHNTFDEKTPCPFYQHDFIIDDGNQFLSKDRYCLRR